ncbi:hypothetical protein [Rodentibacter genomosp. 2]|uniref:Sel1 repeat family protein n=1 Tax=Rodentibacter genomosp. 2 TaxID=1908266 RepID=A0A1V3JQI7_9PAST|nr:hypothetical protein [Rodentibacter genomosp. 2]OOF58860.1 hypothetical protein BKK55_01215 [Rodentibacter genomosp. 2]
MIKDIRKAIFLLMCSMLGIGIIFLEGHYQATKPNPIYNEFLAKIKMEDYFKAHKIIYPLVLEMDKEALKLISDTYYYGLGVKADMTKANIWKERSECQCLDTGSNEYKKYNESLKKGDFKVASTLLQESAEKGNKEAIYFLKNDKYLQENKLIISPNWITYWKTFDYDNLYPFCSKIEECKNDLVINKSNLDK